MDARDHNRHAWDHQVGLGNRWTIPVGASDIDAARAGRCRILLTPNRPVPAGWLEPLVGREVLCLASGGGQQGPLLAAAGARVTVLDNSPAQLQRDREVAERHGLALHLVEGDMRDLSVFGDGRFELVVHPVANVFVPEIQPIWQECYRVLQPGGSLLAGFDQALRHIFDVDAYERGELIPRRALPTSDLDELSEAERSHWAQQGRALEFGHTLEQQIGGQIDAGFLITGFYEDRDREEDGDLLSRYTPIYIVTRALKPEA